jgi:hypothetical protein
METDLTRQLEELFREVGKAHHQAYIEWDGADPEWPVWYADYLRDRLAPLLDTSFKERDSSICWALLRTGGLSALRVRIGQVLRREVITSYA